MTWASAASGTIPCRGTNSAGTLTAASYTQSFAYDTLNRLTSGPLGAYSYDASGNLTCRAPTSTHDHLAAQIDPPVGAVYTLAR